MNSWAKWWNLGPHVKNLQIGDRVVVPFTIACGHCYYCQNNLWSLCDNSNPNSYMAEEDVWLLGRRACSATRTFMAAMPAGRPNTPAFPFADIGPDQSSGWSDR